MLEERKRPDGRLGGGTVLGWYDRLSRFFLLFFVSFPVGDDAVRFLAGLGDDRPNSLEVRDRARGVCCSESTL